MHAIVSRSLIMLSIAVMLITTGRAPAQGGNRSTMIQSDGESTQVLTFAQPDLNLAAQPDLLRSDLWIFRDELQLSEAQEEVVRRLLDAYLLEFAEIAAEIRDTEKNLSPTLGGGHGDTVDDEEGGSGADERAVETAIILDELQKAGIDIDSMDDFPVQPQIMIGMSMGMEEGDEEPTPSISVGVSFEGEDDAMTEEMRAKLQVAVDKMVPRLTEHFRADALEQMAAAMAGEAMTGADAFDAIWQELQELRRQLGEFLRHKKALRQKYLVQVQEILAEVQLERWPAFERTLTRIKTLTLGSYDGESTNLLGVMDTIDLPDDQRHAAAELLESYTMQLHTALQHRNALLAHVDADIDLAIHEGRREKALNNVDQLSRARTAVRSVNEQFTDLLAAKLGDEWGPRFRAEALAESYPSVYRPTLAQNAFDQAVELPGVDDERQTAITDLRASYELQLAPINVRIARTIRQQQPKRLHQDTEQVFEMVENAGPIDLSSKARDTITDDFRERQALDIRTMRSLYTLFPPEQIALLPKIPKVDIAEPVTAQHADPEMIEIDGEF